MNRPFDKSRKTAMKIAGFCCLGMYLFLSFRGVSCTIKNGV